MKSNRFTEIVITAIALLTFLYPVSSICLDRPIDAKRITTLVIRNHESWGEVGGSTDEFSSAYYYKTDHPDVIDSVFTTIVHSWGGEFGSGSSTTYSSSHYTSDYTFIEGHTLIHYLNSQNETTDIIKDMHNRVIDFTHLPASVQQVERRTSYYNQIGKIDSLRVKSTTSDNMYKLIYDNLGLLTSIEARQGNSTQTTSSSIIYADSLPTNQVNINLDEALQYYDDANLSKWRMIFDTHYQVGSFQNPGGTNEFISVEYHLIPEKSIYFYVHDEQNYLVFNQEGYLKTFYKSSGMYSTEVNFTWENIVPNDDPIAPTPELSLNVYPNPFRNNVNIDLKNSSTAPSDIAIYNIKGQLIRKWDGNKSSAVSWDGKDRFNTDVSRGVYLIQVKQDGKSHTSKIVKF